MNASVAYAIRQMLGIVGFLNGDMASVDDDGKIVNGGLKRQKIMVPMLDEEKAKSEMEILKAERIRQYEGYADGVISRGSTSIKRKSSRKR